MTAESGWEVTCVRSSESRYWFLPTLDGRILAKDELQYLASLLMGNFKVLYAEVSLNDTLEVVTKLQEPAITGMLDKALRQYKALPLAPVIQLRQGPDEAIERSS